MTNFGIPEAAHIVPFAWDNSVSSHDRTGELVPALRHFDIPLDKFHDPNELGSSDIAANMLSLCPSLHKYWGNAVFGLKPMDMTPFLTEDNETPMGKISFQFVWLPRVSGKRTLLPVDLSRQGQDESESLISELRHSTRAENTYAVNTESKAAVYSGQIFYIDCLLGDAMKMHQMLTIQWALNRIGAMSGAADAIKHGFGPPRGPSWRVLAWIAEQVDQCYAPVDVSSLDITAYPHDMKSHDTEDDRLGEKT